MLPRWLLEAKAAVDSLLGREAPVTWFFVWLCVLDFLGMYLPIVLKAPQDFSWFLGGGVGLPELLRWGAIVYAPVPGPDGGIITDLSAREPWRLLAAMFVHLGGLHLVMNMGTLVSLGKATETRFGSGRFAVLYLGSGLVGYLASELWYGIWPSAPATAGASGGLFGLIGALAGYLFARRDPGWKDLLMRVGVVAVAFAVVFPTNNAAHIGGCLAGFPLGMLHYKESRPWRNNRWFAVLGAILTLASVASIILSVTSPVTRTVEGIRDEDGRVMRR
jgi:membrane associated rhomboid family serine protease